MHQLLLESDKVIIKKLASLARLPPCFTFIALPLCIEKGSASPVRTIALLTR